VSHRTKFFDSWNGTVYAALTKTIEAAQLRAIESLSMFSDPINEQVVLVSMAVTLAIMVSTYLVLRSIREYFDGRVARDRNRENIVRLAY